MTKPVTGIVAFDGSDQGSVADIDGNNDIFEEAINDLNTYPNFLTDTGSADSMVVTLAASLTGALTDGLQIQVKVAATNTAATVLNYNGTGTKPVVTMAGTALVADQLIVGAIVSLQYASATSSWMLQTPCVISTTMDVTLTFNGSGSTTATITLKMRKDAGWVSLVVPAATANSGTNSGTMTSNANIPASYRPAGDQSLLGPYIANNGVALATPGILLLSTSGQISIRRDGAGTNWTNTSVCGLNANFPLMYPVA